ncbi:MAG: response regulator [Candidatus Margulisbacteria bacterium]|nr:response regulator [Candidatus Margulisiibacteriota bacterium]MBU1617253.1 response regulator [Candidatus Margulisiibacteriota bacterium]
MLSKTSIVLLTDDPGLESTVREAAPENRVRPAPDLETAKELVRSEPATLVIIDNDLKDVDGLTAFRQLRLTAPDLKVLMVSSANDIPLAVSAAKLGVADFLKKPFAVSQLKEAIERLAGRASLTFTPLKTDWSKGEGLTKLYKEIQSLNSTNILLFGEQGIEKKPVADLIHRNSQRNQRRFRSIDLASFRRENLEAYFWTSVQELLAAPTATTMQDEDERCGTLYLENFDRLDQGFKSSILEFFRKRKESLDQTAIVIVGTDAKPELLAPQAAEYAKLVIPSLRERKGDFPFIMSAYLQRFVVEHDKNIKGISPEAVSFLAAYDFPGNYRELGHLLEQAVLTCRGDIILVGDLSVNYKIFKEIFLKKAKSEGLVTLDEIRRAFEAGLFNFLALKNGDDLGGLAKYFDLPRTAIADRMEH